MSAIHDVAAPPGARVSLRWEEWAVSRSLPLPTGGYALHVHGLSELVRYQVIFLTPLEREIVAIQPEDTGSSPTNCPAMDTMPASARRSRSGSCSPR